MKKNLLYCDNPYIRNRRNTHEVLVGSVGIGGNNPIRIQSMTTTDTMDTQGTVEQILRLIDVGCEIVRITAPSIKDAENLGNIRAEMKKQGLSVPLVADIHFTPNAALKAAEFVDKIRINPGNYADRKKFEIRDYTENEYEEALDYIREKFTPLVLKCKENGVAMRIGTNHGSLSDRIMNRFGDTPEGMVESALEFLRICEELNYNQVVLSMKASNTQVMIQAYRLLAARMNELNMTYPFHLGVTEAGAGEDGRIKSALGIGTLLEDGIGDTIRVSLTEDPWYEIPVAKLISESFNQSFAKKYPIKFSTESLRNPFKFERHSYDQIKGNRLNLGENSLIRGGIKFSSIPSPEEFKNFLTLYGPNMFSEDPCAEFISFPVSTENDIIELLHLIPITKEFPAVPEMIISTHSLDLIPAHLPFQFKFVEWNINLHTDMGEATRYSFHDKPLIITINQGNYEWQQFVADIIQILQLNGIDQILISGKTDDHYISFYRELIEWQFQNELNFPMVLQSDIESSEQKVELIASTNLGSILADGWGNLVLLGGNAATENRIRLIFNILQAARQRTTKTEYISCPSCGRTLFNLQQTTERIKAQTGHLKGVKIAIMGCIVNGPGEMADADFGYVGSGPGKIDLYVGKNVVKKSIPQEIADATLVELIKTHGRWVDPIS